MYSLVNLSLCLFVIYVVLCISVFKCAYVLLSTGVSLFVCTLLHLCLSDVYPLMHECFSHLKGNSPFLNDCFFKLDM